MRPCVRAAKPACRWTHHGSALSCIGWVPDSQRLGNWSAHNNRPRTAPHRTVTSRATCACLARRPKQPQPPQVPAPTSPNLRGHPICHTGCFMGQVHPPTTAEGARTLPHRKVWGQKKLQGSPSAPPSSHPSAICWQFPLLTTSPGIGRYSTRPLILH